MSFNKINAEASDNELVTVSKIPLESITAMAEHCGIFALNEEAANELAEDVSYRLKIILQSAAKFMNHGIRQKLITGDIDRSLNAHNIEPQYGFHQFDYAPFNFASGGGRELSFGEDNDVNLAEMLLTPIPKLPLDVTLRTHWLCVEGVQPTVPENPPPLSKEAQKFESVDPMKKLSTPKGKDLIGHPLSSKAARLRANESVTVKQLATHELSVEQQLYYKEITEACVGSDEAKRAEALQSLAVDPGLHEMLPRMCTFISEGVKVNVVQNNLAFLIYLMRMVRALLDNPTLYLEKYLHEIIPSISTCIVSRQLCTRPEGNHWALRDFASRLMAQICKTFNTSTNNLQTRVTRLFGRALADGVEKLSLPSMYGAIQGLSELGPEVIKILIIPNVKTIGSHIKQRCSQGVNQSAAKVAADNIQNQLLKVLPPVILHLRQPPDNLEEYVNDYGYLGPMLLSAVTNARAIPNNFASTSTVSQVANIGTVSTDETSTIDVQNTLVAESSLNSTNEPSNVSEIDIESQRFNVSDSSNMRSLPEIKSEHILQSHHGIQGADFTVSSSTSVIRSNPESSTLMQNEEEFLGRFDYDGMPNLG